MRWVTEATYLGGYKLKIRFDGPFPAFFLHHAGNMAEGASPIPDLMGSPTL